MHGCGLDFGMTGGVEHSKIEAITLVYCGFRASEGYEIDCG